MNKKVKSFKSTSVFGITASSVWLTIIFIFIGLPFCLSMYINSDSGTRKINEIRTTVISKIEKN